MREAENAPSLEQMLGNTAWIKALARRLVSEPSAADDLIQDAYVAALRRPPLDPEAWTPWLRRVLGNFARLRHRERVNRAKRETAVARPERVSADPQAVLERAEIQKRLTELVLELPEPYRSTVLLRFFEGLSPREIAEAQGAPVTTVRSRLSEALDRLRGATRSIIGGRSGGVATVTPPPRWRDGPRHAGG